MMRALVFLLLAAVASAKVFERCEWAQVLKNNGMDGYKNVSLASWVCLSQWESGYDTKATNLNTDGSTDFGIFQINSHWWCYDGRTHTYNGCRISCSDLLTDDVTAAIKCAKQIVGERKGISAWYGWIKNCKGKDLRSYLEGCDL